MSISTSAAAAATCTNVGAQTNTISQTGVCAIPVQLTTNGFKMHDGLEERICGDRTISGEGDD